MRFLFPGGSGPPALFFGKGAVMAKNLEIDGNTITLFPRIPLWWVVTIYTMVFLGILGEGAKEVVRAVEEGRGPLPVLVTMVVFALIWAFLVRNFHSRIIFDLSSRTVHKKTFLGYKELMGFDAIDSIAPVIESHQCVGSNTYYKIAVVGDRYGKGVRLTPSLTVKELEQFEKVDLPLLLERLDLPERVAGTMVGDFGQTTSVPQGPPKDTVSYRRNGSAYSLRFRTRVVFLLLVSGAFLVGGLATLAPDTRLLLFGMAVAALWFAFCNQTSLVLDVAARTITLYTGFGLRKKRYSFGDFEGLSSTRQIINLIPSGTFLHMRVANRKVPIFLGLAYLSAKKLNRIGDETLRIIDAGADEAGSAAAVA